MPKKWYLNLPNSHIIYRIGEGIGTWSSEYTTIKRTRPELPAMNGGSREWEFYGAAWSLHLTCSARDWEPCCDQHLPTVQGSVRVEKN